MLGRRTCSTFLFVSALAAALTCVPEARAGQIAQKSSGATSVNYTVHGGYVVSSQFESALPASFHVIDDQKQFDRIFSVAPAMEDKSGLLPAGAFESRIVIVVIKRGPYIWGYQVEDVSRNQDILYVSYRLSLEDGGATTFTSPLLISIEKQKLAAVVFIENGRTIKKLKVR